MERIVLEVDAPASKIYRQLSLQSKKQFNQAVSLMLKKVGDDNTLNDYMAFLDTLGNKAIENGLTEEILEKLLAEHE